MKTASIVDGPAVVIRSSNANPVAVWPARCDLRTMYRADVDVRFTTVDSAEIRAEIVAHHRRQPYLGDFFLGRHQLTGDAVRVVIDGAMAGAAASRDGCLAYFRLDHAHRRLSRQALESYLVDRGVSRAYVASWDLHHVDLIGGFATAIEPQAYQFEMLNESLLREPIDGLSLRLATRDDLTYVMAQDFLDDYEGRLHKGQLRVAERDGARVGIGVVVEHAICDRAVDIGMYTDPSVRREGVGSSILALLARDALDKGRRVAAGCWWRNWRSRATVERAGLDCVGTIFELHLDANRFAST